MKTIKICMLTSCLIFLRKSWLFLNVICMFPKAFPPLGGQSGDRCRFMLEYLLSGKGSIFFSLLLIHFHLVSFSIFGLCMLLGPNVTKPSK